MTATKTPCPKCHSATVLTEKQVDNITVELRCAACDYLVGRTGTTTPVATIKADLAEAVALLRELDGFLVEEGEARSASGDTPYSLAVDTLQVKVEALLARLDKEAK